MMRVLSAILLAWSFGAYAHDGPSDVIHDLTHRIEDEGATPKLLSARAYEHRSLRAFDAAIADYSSALALVPSYGPALHGLANTYYRAGSYPQATETAKNILITLASDEDHAAAHALLARVAQAEGDHERALMHWREALKMGGEIDWYLGEATSLRALGQFEDAVRALSKARDANPSAAIHRAWIRALIDAEHMDRAMEEIARGLDDARWRSSWLLLRARVHRSTGNAAAMTEDASNALREIRRRLNAQQPDPFLLADAGAALTLLGKDEEAGEHFARARVARIPKSYLASIR